MNDLIAPQSLRDLVAANAIRHATVVADKDVFKINVKFGMAERTVAVRSSEGQLKERVFTSLDAAARFMREKIHLTQYEVDAANFDPLVKRSKRPDTAKRLKDAHAARAYNEWLETKVNDARTGLVDGTNKGIAADEWSDVRAGKLAQRDVL